MTPNEAQATVGFEDSRPERPGTTIGPYKLLQQIGEGGMGVVFMAEQHEPFHRVVALKVIVPGMDTRQVIARFEAERQALAMMDHPNIARVLDAGTTESGRPYFVMELVKGVPITTYCDEKKLSLRERLELFMPVCHAVQHAHQKGIIHRDIKPSNVLVADYDDQPVPKIIDFGVAKATSQKLTDKTMFTAFGQVVGTMEYMSPEQTKLNQLDVDTRTDIYSLGVLLYELLTGTTPFDRKRLRSAAIDEVFRIIREEEPVRPSTSISKTNERPAVAASRRSDPVRLSRMLQGDLDWIVMKALEKDRTRRYPTANGLASDIERYLNDAPVSAGPPSASYRIHKFVRRNRALIAAGSVVVLALVAGLAASVWQAVRATRAEASAIAERDAKEDARRQAVASSQRALKAAEAERQLGKKKPNNVSRRNGFRRSWFRLSEVPTRSATVAQLPLPRCSTEPLRK
jgi:serine/threonine protein kinase